MTDLEKQNTIKFLCSRVDELADWITNKFTMCEINLENVPVWWLSNYENIKKSIRELGE